MTHVFGGIDLSGECPECPEPENKGDDASSPSEFWGNSTSVLSGVTQGDVLIIGWTADSPKMLALLALVPVPTGKRFFVTDNGWLGDGSFRSGEGYLSFTAGSDLPAGTVITYNADDTSSTLGTWAESGQFNPSASGEQLLLFTSTYSDAGDFELYQFLHGVQYRTGSGWDDDPDQIASDSK